MRGIGNMFQMKYLGEKIETTHNHITLRAGGADVVMEFYYMV